MFDSVKFWRVVIGLILIGSALLIVLGASLLYARFLFENEQGDGTLPSAAVGVAELICGVIGIMGGLALPYIVLPQSIRNDVAVSATGMVRGTRGDIATVQGVPLGASTRGHSTMSPLSFAKWVLLAHFVSGCWAITPSGNPYRARVFAINGENTSTNVVAGRASTLLLPDEVVEIDVYTPNSTLEVGSAIYPLLGPGVYILALGNNYEVRGHVVDYSFTGIDNSPGVRRLEPWTKGPCLLLVAARSDTCVYSFGDQAPKTITVSKDVSGAKALELQWKSTRSRKPLISPTKPKQLVFRSPRDINQNILFVGWLLVLTVLAGILLRGNVEFWTASVAGFSAVAWFSLLLLL